MGPNVWDERQLIPTSQKSDPVGEDFLGLGHLLGGASEIDLMFAAFACDFDLDGVQAGVLHAAGKLFADFAGAVSFKSVHGSGCGRAGYIAMAIAGYLCLSAGNNSVAVSSVTNVGSGLWGLSQHKRAEKVTGVSSTGESKVARAKGRQRKMLVIDSVCGLVQFGRVRADHPKSKRNA